MIATRKESDRKKLDVKGEMTDAWTDCIKKLSDQTVSSSSSSCNVRSTHLIKPSHAVGMDNDVTAGTLLPLPSSLQQDAHTQAHVVYLSIDILA